MNKKDKLEVEKEYLGKLYKLRDFIWSYFDKTDEIYNPLLRLTEEAIAEKIDDIAVLRGCKLVKSNKRKKYVFEVGRERLGAADVYLNGELLTSFFDEIVVAQKDDVIYTDLVKGKGSRIPDALYVKALLYSFNDDICHLSDKVKSVLDRDIPKEISEMQARNFEQSRKNRRADT